MPELWFLIVCAFFCGLYRLARRFVEPRAVQSAAPSTPTRSEPPAASRPPSAGELRPLSEWAFDYERMLIASGAATAAQRNRALHLVSALIVPLLGHVRVCELDDELVRSVSRVLAAQLLTDRWDSRGGRAGWAIS